MDGIETVGDIIENREAGAPLPTTAPFSVPRLEGVDPFPFEPGIYFDMPEEIYHQIEAFSTSGIKKLAGSPMIFWAGSWMNANKARVEKQAFFVGHAYHCRILEGAEAFNARYVVEIDRSKYANALESTDEIKDYISKKSFTIMVEGKEEQRFHKPKSKVTEPDGQGGTRQRNARKEDWIGQLLEIDEDAPLWDSIVKNYVREANGRKQISQSLIDEIEIAAMMIERDPSISPLVKGGYAEVTLLWYCKETGIPMKARVDKLKVKRMLDLKSFSNPHEKSVERAIAYDIGSRKYAIQPCVYWEGAAEVRKIVRARGASAVFLWPDEDGCIDPVREENVTNYALKWAKHILPDEWTWIFQMTGAAPISRAVDFSADCATAMITNDIIRAQKRRFVEFANNYGTDAWLDLSPGYCIADEDLPQWSTEI